ncbi:MAG TPA: hypothetical protein VLN48_23425 [Bryobacteraceae bacterium]|nr:hypothetical protein [Bryobacteraceae bacterium]
MTLFLALFALLAADSGAPAYTGDSVVNPVAAVAGMYAPNSFITIYGERLSYVTRAMSPDDLRAGMLPTVLIGTGVQVLINHVPANIYYVSPTQVNVLAPVSLEAGPATIQLVNDGLAGPAIGIVLDAVAPAMFRLNGAGVLAAHLDGTVISPDAPAHRGEVVVIYATGLGPTVPPAIPNRLPTGAAWIARLADFAVWLNGEPVPAARILYAGISPPYAGLFQINLRIPEDAPPDPEIRCGFPERMSLPGSILRIR